MLSVAVRILALLGLAPLRSTGSVLTCRASGGPKGGTVEFTLSDGNRLAKIGGSFPYTKELAPGEEEARGRRGDFRGGGSRDLLYLGEVSAEAKAAELGVWS